LSASTGPSSPAHAALWIGGEFNVGISGDIGRRVIGDDYQELLRQIWAAAAQAAATGNASPSSTPEPG
jgi:hypothetical protein